MPAKKKGFVVCLRNDGFAASLEVRKLYPFIDDLDAEANKLIRVVDESGEDYLYPARLFRKLALPSDIQRALDRARETVLEGFALACCQYLRDLAAAATINKNNEEFRAHHGRSRTDGWSPLCAPPADSRGHGAATASEWADGA